MQYVRENVHKYLQKTLSHSDTELEIFHNVWLKISLGILKLNLPNKRWNGNMVRSCV